MDNINRDKAIVPDNTYYIIESVKKY